jgi:hypothetical protein
MEDIKIGDIIAVHFFFQGKEINTRSKGKKYLVYQKDEKLGIDYMADSDSTTRVWHDEDGFAPLDSFATQTGAVKFQKIE